eukprot:SAG22_NODE_2302_length_2738_cov_3.010610_1_plen_44_part_10
MSRMASMLKMTSVRLAGATFVGAAAAGASLQSSQCESLVDMLGK